MQNMNINSVKLVNSGLKGIVVTYANPSNKDNRTFIDEHVSKKKAPIHEELEILMESLRRHLLDICGYESDDSQEGIYNVSRTEITGITYNDKGFTLTGKYKILGGDKTINLVSPLLKDGEEFASFQDVCVILDNVYAEVKSYMSGEKSFTDEQLVLRFNQGNDGFDQEEFKAMSKEDQYKLATDILEKNGALIFHPEVEGAEVEAEDVVTEADDFELEEKIEPKMEIVKKDSKSSLSMVTEGDSFKIVSEPADAKVSTAQKLKVG